MATMAMFFKRVFFLQADARWTARSQPNPYLLRALPNEDLYFFNKPIDNSRLVRLADPEASGQCLSTIGAASAVAMLLVTALVPGVGEILSGYRLEALKQEEQRLLNDQRGLEVREAALLSPERLQELAAKNDMKQPAAGQVVHLDATGAIPGAVVANNLGGKK